MMWWTDGAVIDDNNGVTNDNNRSDQDDNNYDAYGHQYNPCHAWDLVWEPYGSLIVTIWGAECGLMPISEESRS